MLTGLKNFLPARLVGFAGVATIAALWSSGSIVPEAAACPFCSSFSQTLSEEMAAMDTVAVASIVPGSETESDAEFEILAVLRGDNLIRAEQKLRVNYFGKAKPEQKFLLMGVDPPDLLWSSPLPVTDVAIEYVQALQELPKDQLQRLAFFLDYLEHPETMLARDAYDEFAKADYGDVKKLKDRFDRPQLIDWIKDVTMPPERKRLYLVMLGVCGHAEDADLLETMLRSDNDSLRSGLDAMIACYVTLKGADGLQLVDELFLKNKQSQYADTYAAIMALRFHGTEGNVVEKERVLESMRLILDRPELADLVIPDLARWEDWTQIDKLAGLFKTADDKSSWVRVPVINYLRACPLPEAESQLEELKEIDPAAFKRATSFFPQPKASSSSSSTDSSSLVAPAAAEKLAEARSAGRSPFAQPRELAAALPAHMLLRGTSSRSGAALAGSVTNLPMTLSVLSMVSVSCWLAMWLSISGAGNLGPVARLLIATSRSA